MPAAARRRSDVDSIQLDPGVGEMLGRPVGKADDELGRITLPSQQVKENEGVDEAARTAFAEAKAFVDRPAEPPGWVPAAVIRTRPSEPCDEVRKRISAQTRAYENEREPNSDSQLSLFCWAKTPLLCESKWLLDNTGH
jgi:hypothetical protein